jgi:predicted nucleotidyltransferase
MNLPKPILKDQPYLEDESILAGYRGSVAHGTYLPSDDPSGVDDKDLMFVVIPTIDYYFGLNSWGSRGTKEHKIGEYDIVSYELLKFMRLLAKGNPNVLCMLWLDSNYYIKRTLLGNELIRNRELFSTRQVYKSFVGYARGQIHRMTHCAYNGRMGEKRKRLVDRFGFDVKHGGHCIRLLRQGIEFLATGELIVTRPDAPQLIEIKRGLWTLEQVKAEADRLFVKIEDVYTNSRLPARTDMDAVNDLCARILEERFYAK